MLEKIIVRNAIIATAIVSAAFGASVLIDAKMKRDAERIRRESAEVYRKLNETLDLARDL